MPQDTQPCKSAEVKHLWMMNSTLPSEKAAILMNILTVLKVLFENLVTEAFSQEHL